MKPSKVLLLNDLPAEILGLMLSWSSTSYLFLDLWKCGDTLLKAKLISGVTHVTLAAACDRFPRALHQLRALRYLSITSSRCLFENRLDWRKMVDGLPSTVESLKFLSPDSILALMKYSDVSAVSFAFMQYDAGPSRYVDLSVRLPRLHTLQLRAELSAKDLPGLPSTLTKLIVTKIRVRDGTDYVMAALLPRTLLYLDASIGYTSLPPSIDDIKDDWAMAPPHLEFLETPNFPAQYLDALPKTLTGGNLHGHLGFTFDHFMASSLPPLLQTACIRRLNTASFATEGTHWVEHLPTQLTTLSLREVKVCLTVVDIQGLPRTLTHISVSTTVKFDWNHIREAKSLAEAAKKHLWPANLSTLVIGSEMQTSELELIPASVMDLSICLSRETPTYKVCTQGGSRVAFRFDPSKMLPPKLRKLAVNSFVSEADFELVSSLPNTLATLEVLRHGSEPASLSIESFAMLPDSLVKLICNIPCTLDPIAAGLQPIVLPKHITHLVVHTWSRLWFNVLPRGLTHLDIHQGYFTASETSHADPFKGLPPSLTYLHLNTNKTLVSLSAASLTTLKHLKTLRIANIGIFPSAVLQNLPKTLVSAALRLASRSTSGLPKHLGMTYNSGSRIAEIARFDKGSKDAYFAIPGDP